MRSFTFHRVGGSWDNHLQALRLSPNARLALFERQLSVFSLLNEASGPFQPEEDTESDPYMQGDMDVMGSP